MVDVYKDFSILFSLRWKKIHAYFSTDCMTLVCVRKNSELVKKIISPIPILSRKYLKLLLQVGVDNTNEFWSLF